MVLYSRFGATMALMSDISIIYAILNKVTEINLGHKLRGMAGRYTNLTDDQIRE
jgi:cell division protein YceG involved in septum cleavage